MNKGSLTILNTSVTASDALLRERFAKAKPFKHVLIDDFFNETLARELLEQFPKPDESISLNPYGAIGAKATHPNLLTLGNAYRAVNTELQSSEFLSLLSDITGIEGLLYDEDNYGGGTHENFEGRDLRPHVDFNYHPVSKLHRRINLIVYLNEGWQPAWGGAIALHSDPRSENNEITEYQPNFNRCIIFETSEHSWHGFERITLPPDQKHRSRKSLSIYLYTRERPEEEAHAEHTTFFIPRSLPPHFTVDRTLSVSDVGELGELLGQRDRLIELYQRQQGNRETDSAQAARLRILVAELQTEQHIPTMGYVNRIGAVSGRYTDGWSSQDLRFSIRAERPIRSLRILARIPEHIPIGATLSLYVNGIRHAETLACPGIAALCADVRIGAGEIGAIRIASSATMNPKQLGVSLDERDLGFFLECATFEHTNEPSHAKGLFSARVRPEIYTVIGDCNAICFEGLTFESPQHSEHLTVVRSRWQSYARASDFFKNGRFNEALTRLFIEMRLLYEMKTASESPFTPLMMYKNPEIGELVHYGARPNRKDTVLLFSYGEVDIWDIANMYARRYTFDLPVMPRIAFLPDDENAPETLPTADVRRFFAQQCAPLFQGLLALRDLGFTNIFLHGVPPPGSRRLQHWNSTRLHYKIRVIFNELYEEFCQKYGIGFISIWDDIAINGLRDPKYDKDGVHLTPESAILSIARLREQIAARNYTRKSSPI